MTDDLAVTSSRGLHLKMPGGASVMSSRAGQAGASRCQGIAISRMAKDLNSARDRRAKLVAYSVPLRAFAADNWKDVRTAAASMAGSTTTMKGPPGPTGLSEVRFSFIETGTGSRAPSLRAPMTASPIQRSRDPSGFPICHLPAADAEGGGTHQQFVAVCQGPLPGWNRRRFLLP